jgi:putative intracellular protease/amidase
MFDLSPKSIIDSRSGSFANHSHLFSSQKLVRHNPETKSIATQSKIMVKVVIVGTNASDLKGHATGLWLDELAVPYYRFRSQGYQVVVASPKGGEIPIDQNSLKGDAYTDTCKQFMEDEGAVSKLHKSIPLAEIDWNTVDAIYLSGGHGAASDFPENKELKQAIEMLMAHDKVVAAQCHGPIALAQCMVNGQPLVKGKKVTCFSDSEEEDVKLTKNVPFLIESKFKELGGHVENAKNWTSNVLVDGHLVTGQNPMSGEACAAAVIKVLEGK